VNEIDERADCYRWLPTKARLGSRDPSVTEFGTGLSQPSITSVFLR